MKVSIEEFDHAIQIRIQPETVKESAQLMRLGVMTKKETEIIVSAYKSGEIEGVLHCEKKKNATGTIRNR